MTKRIREKANYKSMKRSNESMKWSNEGKKWSTESMKWPNAYELPVYNIKLHMF